jgi:hypothetical protein
MIWSLACAQFAVTLILSLPHFVLIVLILFYGRLGLLALAQLPIQYAIGCVVASIIFGFLFGRFPARKPNNRMQRTRLCASREIVSLIGRVADPKRWASEARAWLASVFFSLRRACGQASCSAPPDDVWMPRFRCVHPCFAFPLRGAFCWVGLAWWLVGQIVNGTNGFPARSSPSWFVGG